jgi:hypothetical protein
MWRSDERAYDGEEDSSQPQSHKWHSVEDRRAGGDEPAQSEQRRADVDE